ncbi:MAG TPA: HAMP domain-containing sensor histidine kinase [Blastocatellia bacterium]|nr:HAMP domain-containing sensor histidine kinase [Blastocatellia bacterium]
MIEDASVYKGLLRQQAFAAFEYLGDGGFRLLCEPADFCRTLLGEDVDTAAAIRLGDKFPFLESFIAEAQVVWDSESAEGVESGWWVETTPDGRELGLEATAARVLGRRLLLIQNPQGRYDRQLHLMQAARDAALEHERLQREIQKKEILLHCIVHDLSQPLTTMRAAFSLLERQDLPPRLKQTLDSAQREAVRQHEMIKGILTAFSGDLATARGQAHAPDLGQCAKETVETFRDAFLNRGARIELDPALDLSGSWRVAAEESRLLRVYGNLVENALRHCKPDSLVTVGVIDEGTRLKAFVNDEGPGLSDDQMPRLFTLFGKGPDSDGGKMGLGLYFCRITIERWGGTIGCEMRPTGGAHFWFRLPRA